MLGSCTVCPASLLPRVSQPIGPVGSGPQVGAGEEWCFLGGSHSAAALGPWARQGLPGCGACGPSLQAGTEYGRRAPLAAHGIVSLQLWGR